MYNIRKTITGKNLWQNSDYYAHNSIGNDYTIIDTGFTYKRTNTGGRYIAKIIPVKAGLTYTFSANMVANPSQDLLLYLYRGSVYGTQLKASTTGVLTYTATADEPLYFTFIMNSSLQTATATNIQVEVGSSVTSYESYENPEITITDGAESDLAACNIEGNSYQYTTTGKNLLNKAGSVATSAVTAQSLATGVRITNASGGTYRYTGFNIGQSELLGKTITIHSNISASSTNNGLLCMYMGNASTVAISGVSNSTLSASGSKTVTLPSSFANNCDRFYILAYANVNGTDTAGLYCDYTDLQVELGSSYTGYEDYTGKQASPSPEYPQEVEVAEGQNLLNLNDITATANATIQKNDNGFTYTRTAAGSNDLFAAQTTLYLKPNTTYSIYMGKNNRQSLYFYTNNLWGTSLPATSIANIAGQYCWYKFTTTDTGKAVIGFYLINESQNTSGTISNIIVLEGTKTLQELKMFTPYNNLGINVLSRNIYENSQDFSGVWENNSMWTTDSETYNGLVVKKRQATWNGIYKKIEIQNGKTYTFSFYAKSDEARQINVYTNPVGVSVMTSPANKSFNITTSWQRYSFTFTATRTDISGVRIENPTAITDCYTYICGYQLEEGSTMTEYIPYTNITTPIDLQGNFIGKIGSIKDEINIDDLGNVILTKRIGKIVLNGSEDWSTEATNQTGKYRMRINHFENITNNNYLKPTSNTTLPPLLSNYYIPVPAGGTGTYGCIQGVSLNQNTALLIYDNTYNTNDATSYKTWLSTHNIILYYALATPYTVNLGKANIDLNDGINYITFLTGLDTRNTIEYESDTSYFREHSYLGESLYKADLRIYHNNTENIIDMEQIARITIKDPIIDTTSQIYYLGSFIAKSLTIKFKNFDGIDIASGDKVTLQIAQEINGEDIYIPIGEFYVDELAENYFTTCEIVCNDASVKFKQAVDYSSCFGDDDKATIDEVLGEICRICDVPLGKYPTINGDIEVGVYDSSVSGKKWISYIAELKGCNAKIDRFGRLTLIPLKQSSKVSINASESSSWNLGEKYTISQVRYYNGNIWYEYPLEPENTQNILYIRNDNPYINSDLTLERIYENVANCEIYNVKTTNYGDITLDAYDNITYNVDEDSYQTLNDNTIVYEMSLMTTVDNKISTKQQETTTNVVAGDKDTQLRKIKTTVDLVNATATTTAEEVSKINRKFDDYVTAGTYNTLVNRVDTIQTSTYTKTEVSQILKGEYVDSQGNPVQVSKTVTESGTFSNEGLRIQKEDENHNVISKTSGLFNELGVDIKRTSDNQNVLYAGMVDESDTRFTGYEGQTIVGTENVIVKTYLVVGGNSRFQDYTDENNNKGTGCFDIGG